MVTMEFQLLLSMAVFSFVTAVTPGPNNTVLMTLGLNYGFKKSLPFLAGIQTGIILVLAALALGLNAILEANPQILTWLRYAGFAYILYLSWRIIRSPEVSQDFAFVPLGYFKAVSLQFVNPKVWITMTAFVASYIPAEISVVEYLFIFALVTASKIPGAAAWSLFGQVLRKLLAKPKQRLIFNVLAASALALSMLPLVFAN